MLTISASDCGSCHHGEAARGRQCLDCHSGVFDRTFATDLGDFPHSFHVVDMELACDGCHGEAPAISAQANQEAKELLARYEQQLADAEEEVRAIVLAGGRDAEKIGQEMIDKAKAEAAAEQQRALEHIDAATAAALKELAERGADLAVELAGKIVRTELKPGDHVQLVQRAVASFADRRPSNN